MDPFANSEDTCEMQHNGQSWYNYLIPPTSVQTLHITRYFMLKSVRWYKRFYTCSFLKKFQHRVRINSGGPGKT